MSSRPSSKARRRKASAASRLRPFWIVIVLLLAVSGLAGYFFATWPALRPHHVSVSGNHIVPNSQILAKAAVAPDSNLWLQNTRAMALRIESIPYVATAALHRRPPGTLFISVTERVPFAIVDAAGARVVVDHDLRVLQTADGDGVKNVPVFTLRSGIALEPGMFLHDATLTALRDDDDALVAAHIAPDALTTDTFGELVATLHSGVRLLLGDDEDLQKKIPLIDPILVQVQRAHRPISAIDLRASNTPIVVYKK